MWHYQLFRIHVRFTDIAHAVYRDFQERYCVLTIIVQVGIIGYIAEYLVIRSMSWSHIRAQGTSFSWMKQCRQLKIGAWETFNCIADTWLSCLEYYRRHQSSLCLLLQSEIYDCITSDRLSAGSKWCELHTSYWKSSLFKLWLEYVRLLSIVLNSTFEYCCAGRSASWLNDFGVLTSHPAEKTTSPSRYVTRIFVRTSLTRSYGAFLMEPSSCLYNNTVQINPGSLGTCERETSSMRILGSVIMPGRTTLQCNLVWSPLFLRLLLIHKDYLSLIWLSYNLFIKITFH